MDRNANQGAVAALDTNLISCVCTERRYCRIQQYTYGTAVQFSPGVPRRRADRMILGKFRDRADRYSIVYLHVFSLRARKDYYDK